MAFCPVRLTYPIFTLFSFSIFQTSSQDIKINFSVFTEFPSKLSLPWRWFDDLRSRNFIHFYLKEENCTGKGGRASTQRIIIIAQRERDKQTKSDFVWSNNFNSILLYTKMFVFWYFVFGVSMVSTIFLNITITKWILIQIQSQP